MGWQIAIPLVVDDSFGMNRVGVRDIASPVAASGGGDRNDPGYLGGPQRAPDSALIASHALRDGADSRVTKVVFVVSERCKSVHEGLEWAWEAGSVNETDERVVVNLGAQLLCTGFWRVQVSLARANLR